MALSKIDADGVSGLQATLTAATTVPSEGGAATTNLVQGLAKCWTRFNPSTNTELGSLNQSSRSDDGVGLTTINFVNVMNNGNYAGHQQNSDTATPTAGAGAHISAVFGETTSSVRAAYGYSGGSGGITWTLTDHNNQKFVLHGDLA